MRSLYFLKQRTGKLNEGLAVQPNTVLNASSLPFTIQWKSYPISCFPFSLTSKKVRGMIYSQIQDIGLNLHLTLHSPLPSPTSFSYLLLDFCFFSLLFKVLVFLISVPYARYCFRFCKVFCDLEGTE